MQLNERKVGNVTLLDLKIDAFRWFCTRIDIKIEGARPFAAR